ncbi:MAG: HAD family hydrolase [Haliscomenobacteraceae bacterium CHB4]|nr:HAD family hydrolase [Haliscomenobacteraceae bacterium CHB4]
MHGADFSVSVFEKAARIRLLLTDCDGVLTDAGVYYSERGEALKRFSMRDGMGVERLRELVGVETGIVTGENSAIVAHRAAKLGIAELHPGAKNKQKILLEILERRNLRPEQVAYIGDDLNDEAVMLSVGLSACPADAMEDILKMADYICLLPGGHGAFREFAELIIRAKTKLAANGHSMLKNQKSQSDHN